MLKLVNVILLATLISGCAKSPATSASPADKNMLVGFWAMLPLKNGIANVVEFRADDQALLHSFNCENPLVEIDVETSHYVVDKNSQTIQLSSPGYKNQLKILGIVGRVMKLEQPLELENESLTFSYLKVTKAVPLCSLYVPKNKNENKETAYKPTDFVASPVIPAHKDLAKYVGKWQEKNATQLEIVKNSKGQYTLFHAPSENWHHLYNDVHWVGDELYFQSYAYSEKPELFSHPYHKSQTPHQIQLLPNGKLRLSFIIGGEKSSYELTRE